MDPVGIPTHCLPSTPTDDGEQPEAIAEGMWVGFQNEKRTDDFVSIVDAPYLLSKVIGIMAQGKANWAGKHWNGMKLTLTEHHASVYREIATLLEAEVLKEAERDFKPRTPTNPATLLATGKLGDE